MKRIRIKEIFPLIITSSILLACSNAYADFKVFTNQDGKKITAQIISASNSEVKIERKDKKTFNIKISSLSEQDQTYIKEWSEKNKSYGFKIKSKKKSGKVAGRDGHGHKTENRAQQYLISIDHSTEEAITNAEVHYKIFQKGKTPRVHKEKISSLHSGSPMEFKTKLTADRLEGLWVRIYKDSKMIGEYKTNTAKVRKATW